MFLKRPFSVIWGKSWLFCSGPGEIELWAIQAILPEDRALSQYDSFCGKMFMYRLFLCDMWEVLTRLFRSQGDRASKHSSDFPVDRASSQMIVFVARWSWRSHFSVILGKSRLICSGLGETELSVIFWDHWLRCCWEQRLPSHTSRRQSFEPFSRESELQVNTIVLVARCSWKGHFSVIPGKSWLVCSGLGETELCVDTTVLLARWHWKGCYSDTG